MKPESLEKAKLIIMIELIESDLPQEDKLELMINLNSFLDKEYYESDKEVLKKKRYEDKYDSNNQGRIR